MLELDSGKSFDRIKEWKQNTMCSISCYNAEIAEQRLLSVVKYYLTRMWAMPSVMAALPNIGDALCSTPQRFADAHYSSALQ